jgi:hypothetical protein
MEGGEWEVCKIRSCHLTLYNMMPESTWLKIHSKSVRIDYSFISGKTAIFNALSACPGGQIVLSLRDLSF